LETLTELEFLGLAFNAIQKI